ncbi:MAG: diaminopimelate decarboxylase [Candidatus Tectomicrobia bacterium]|nr:diaminopimelate decarboxylase [Candidatus Tectomicrobia bacterium]
MDVFTYKNGELACEDVPLRDIVEQVGTPCYVYSSEHLTRQFRAFDEAFSGLPHLVCFAMKANSNLAVLRLFGTLGGGIDVVSGGEIYRAVRAGIPADRIVFAGVGKTVDEIIMAMKRSILMFNVESPGELDEINRVAESFERKAPVALRVNPDVDPKTHPYISTGLKKSKFGIDIHAAVDEYRRAAELPWIEVVGVHCHIGSQITTTGPFADAAGKVAALVGRLREEGLRVRYVNLGGGLGITYRDEAPPAPSDMARAVVPLIRETGCILLFEPGRSLVGNGGVLLSEVLYKKQTPAKRFYVVDAAMNDLIRPSLYESYHEIRPLSESVKSRERGVADVVGGICESGDFLAKDRELPAFEPGDLFAVMSAGAYGFAMSSNYNARPRAAEVLVRGSEFSVVRRRETYQDLVRGETIPEFLQEAGSVDARLGRGSRDGAGNP